MSSDDIEILERAFSRLDSDHFETVLPLVDERFEMVTTPEIASEPDTYRGPDGVRRWFESFLEVMDSVRLEPVSFEQVADGQVIVEFVIRARGQRSGIEAEQHGITLATVADGKLQRLEFFTNIEELRAAARSPRS